MKTFAELKNQRIFATAIQEGPVVQLVRIHACHAWGRGFESRPDRFLKKQNHLKVCKSWVCGLF